MIKKRRIYKSYVYDNGFGLVKYICKDCKGQRLRRIHEGGFSPSYYICQDCNSKNLAPYWKKN
ncbi:MAG: hypothetical protein ACOC3V_04285 [bacterium]